MSSRKGLRQAANSTRCTLCSSLVFVHTLRSAVSHMRIEEKEEHDALVDVLQLPPVCAGGRAACRFSAAESAGCVHCAGRVRGEARPRTAALETRRLLRALRHAHRSRTLAEARIIYSTLREHLVDMHVLY